MLVSTRFQVLFHSPPGVLFTFPSRYCSSIGHQVVFRLRWWSTSLPTAIPRVPRYSGSSSSASASLTRLSLSVAGLPMPFCSLPLSNRCPKPRTYCYIRFSLCRFRSPLLAVSRLISLPRPTQMFQFRRFPSLPYLIQIRIHGLFPWEFPHSEICGSTVICTFPQLIAAYRVLLRLLMPRHPSCALFSLTFSIANSLNAQIIWQPLRICKIASVLLCTAYPLLSGKTF